MVRMALISEVIVHITLAVLECRNGSCPDGFSNQCRPDSAQPRLIGYFPHPSFCYYWIGNLFETNQ